MRRELVARSAAVAKRLAPSKRAASGSAVPAAPAVVEIAKVEAVTATATAAAISRFELRAVRILKVFLLLGDFCPFSVDAGSPEGPGIGACRHAGPLGIRTPLTL
jgi:hypothetical protein